MKFVPGLLPRKLNRWTNKKWYHQRFDGSPYLLHLIAEAEIKDESRKHGAHNLVHYCFFDNGKADWYIEMEDIKRIYTILLNLGKKNPKISKDLIKVWKKDQDKFYLKCKQISKKDITTLNDKQLMKLHDEFVNLAINKNTSSSIIDGFALGTDELLAAKIQEIYDSSSILTSSIKFTEVFSTLTAPVNLSFINEAEVSLLKTALKIKKNPKQRQKLLQQHQKNYFWIHNNYVTATILDTAYFGQEVDKLFSLGMDLKKEIEKIENTPKINLKKKQDLMKKLKIHSEVFLLMTISEDFTYWQDERKKSTFWSAHYGTLILNEIGKRLGIPEIELKYMSPREVSSVFKQKPLRAELQQRMANTAFYWDLEGYDCITGSNADMVKKKIIGDITLSDVDDFRGLTASMGKASGMVKVLKSSTEMAKVQQGDILVAVMTRPDYIPAMKKAAAIVTDEGGVTCHAAIVARELGIPCIIGTKIATKILKDGMKVEVNANHGWVKILK